MSLPINLKFEVPKQKAPPPTRTSLWPALTPPPAQKPKPEKTAEPQVKRPIIPPCPASSKAAEGRRAVVFASPRRGRKHGRSLLVKCALPGILLFALLSIVNLGCTQEKPKADGSVLDVAPQQAAYQPAPYQPTPTSEPAPYTGPTYKSPTYKTESAPRVAARPAASSATPPAVATPVAVAPAARTYVVQKGDTLTSIARAHYGDGNQWRKIAAANPKLNPNAVRVGQELVVP